MLSIAKKFIMALIATIALPAHLHESAVVQSEPSTVSSGAVAGTTLPVSAQQPDVLHPESAAAKDQSALPEPWVVDRSPPAPKPLAKLQLEIGDKLKIGFYETIDIGSDGQSARDGSGPQSALRTFYQRMDLSGEYTV